VAGELLEEAYFVGQLVVFILAPKEANTGDIDSIQLSELALELQLWQG